MNEGRKEKGELKEWREGRNRKEKRPLKEGCPEKSLFFENPSKTSHVIFPLGSFLINERSNVRDRYHTQLAQSKIHPKPPKTHNHYHAVFISLV